MAAQGDGQQHVAGISANVLHPTSPTAGRRASKRSLDCSQQPRSDAAVIDLCDGHPPIDLSFSDIAPGVIHLHDSSRPRSASAKQRRRHLPDADSRQQTSATEIDLTDSTSSQQRHVDSEQLFAFATKTWEETGQLHQLRKAQKLYVESKHQNWSKSTLKRHIFALVGDDLIQRFKASKPKVAQRSQAIGASRWLSPSVSPSTSPSSSPRPSMRGVSLTDVIDVTENYSGAMRTADQRIEHASSDAALAQLLAEKAELERQLKAALASKQSSHPNRPLRAPLPPHWAPMPEDMHVMYVQLPLPQGCTPATGDQAMRPQSPPLDQETLEAMMHQGLNRADAEAALRRCSGDGDEALLYAMECMDQGGAAACAARSLADAADGCGDEAARAAAEQALQDSALQEAGRVLDRLTENHSSFQLSDVRRIERVQNPHLWTKYCLRRHEVELAAGPHGLNEQMLFHGCRKDTMAVITQEGFDIRVSGMGCALGTGTYFAGNSDYSLGYVDKGPDPAAIATGRHTGMVNFGALPPQAPTFGWGGPPMASYGTFALSSGAVSQAPAFSFGNSGFATGLLPHPSSQGITSPVKKRSAKSKAAQREEDVSKPDFLPETKAMMLCRVALGRLAPGSPGMRLPPKGFDAVTQGGGMAFPQALQSGIFAVFDNSQAYPEYIVHFTAKSRN